MIYTVTLNPALDKTVEIPHFALDTVNRITALRTDPGGKGINVSKVIAKFGGTSKALGILAGNTGRMIAEALQASGLDCCFIQGEGETRTNLKIVDPAGHTNTDINEPGIRVDQAVLDKLLGRLIGMIAAGDIVVLSGSLPAGAPCDTYRVWVEACKKSGAKVFLDADGELLAEGLKGAPYLIKPNQDELSRLMGRRLETLEELAEAAHILLSNGIARVAVSMGGKGALYVGRPSHVVRRLNKPKDYWLWLAVFGVLALCQAWMAAGLFSGAFEFYYRQLLSCLFVLGLGISLFWFFWSDRRRPSGPLPKGFLPMLLASLALAVALGVFIWSLMARIFPAYWAVSAFPPSWLGHTTHAVLQAVGILFAAEGMFSLYMARVYDRRWRALHILGLTGVTLCLFILSIFRSMSIDTTIVNWWIPYLWWGIKICGAGLIGMLVSLC